MATLDYQEDEKNTVTARDTSDPNSKYKRYPIKPGVWDQIKESFEPTGTRAMLETIRRRRQSSND